MVLTFPLTPVAGRSSKGYHFEFSLIPGVVYTNAEIEAFSPAKKLVNTGGLLTHDFMSFHRSNVKPEECGGFGPPVGSYFID